MSCLIEQEFYDSMKCNTQEHLTPQIKGSVFPPTEYHVLATYYVALSFILRIVEKER